MVIAANYITKFDYFLVNNFIVNYVSVVTGQVLLNDVVFKVTMRNYNHYLTDEVCVWTFRFATKKLAQVFYQLLQEANLEDQFKALNFYTSVQECLVYTQDFSVSFTSTLLPSSKALKNNEKMFVPQLSGQYVRIKFPNTHVLYINITVDPNQDNLMSEHFVQNDLSYELAHLIRKTGNFMFFKNLVELDGIYGQRLASYAFYDNAFYFICDLSFSILRQITLIINRLYSVSNQHVMNEILDRDNGFKCFYADIMRKK